LCFGAPVSDGNKAFFLPSADFEFPPNKRVLRKHPTLLTEISFSDVEDKSPGGGLQGKI
jgi:hypothetical protein